VSQLKNSRSQTIIFLKTALILAALTGLAVSCLKQNTQKADLTITGIDTNVPVTQTISGKKYDKFSHEVAEHKEISCDSCHQRESGSQALKYSGHDSCIKCHLSEFTNPESGICVVCHDKLDAVPVTMRPFPARFDEGFNMKFDHGVHSQGTARPAQGCAACHSVSGASQTIPADISSHANCFTCHTPESNISSCSICHTIAPYKRTQPVSTIFKASFRHSDHTARQGVNCADCHTVKGGAPQSRQVTGPVAIQHFPANGQVSCRTCHNDSRAFGEKNFANCRRCHTGSGFDMLP
jgi:c(7)-type cytochrome triheme protein